MELLLRFVLGWLAILALSHCASATSPDAGAGDATVARWACPPTWVPAAQGGCGPAVLLCVPDGGAAPGACQGAELSRSPALALVDGGTGTGFHRFEDARSWTLGGGWDPSLLGLLQSPAEHLSASPPPAVGPDACPRGWAVSSDGSCDPLLAGSCAAGGEALPAGACTATRDTDCPSATWPTPGPESLGAVVVRVRSGADPSVADGSEARPFATVEAGLRAAGRGGWVLLAAGTYAESLGVQSEAHVLGVCARRVVLAPPPEAAAAVRVGARLELRGVTVRGGQVGLAVESGAELLAQRVRCEGASAWGVEVRGAATLGDFVVSAPAGQGGVRVSAGGSVSATRCAVVANAREGLEVTGGAATLADCVVRDTATAPDGSLGHGLVASGGARVDATRTVFQDSAGSSAWASGLGTQLAWTDVLLRLGASGAPRTRAAVWLGGGASLAATRWTARRSSGWGLVLEGAGTAARVEQSVLAETTLGERHEAGLAVLAQQGTSFTARHTLFLQNGAGGVRGLGPQTRVDLEDCALEHSRYEALVDPALAGGVVVQSQASLSLARVRLRGEALRGVSVAGAGTRAVLEELFVQGVRTGPHGEAAYALQVGDGATASAHTVALDEDEGGAQVEGAGSVLEVDDVLVERLYGCLRPELCPVTGLAVLGGGVVRGVGLSVDEVRGSGVEVRGAGSLFDVSESTVFSNTPGPNSSSPGYGVSVAQGAEARLERSVVFDNGAASVAAFGPGTRVTLRECMLAEADRREGFGAGLQLSGGATAWVERSWLVFAPVAGLLAVGAGTSAVLTDCILSGGDQPRLELGLGIVLAGASLQATRLALEDLRGAGIVALADPANPAQGATVRLEDLWLRGVTDGPLSSAAGSRAVALGLSVDAVSSAQAQRALLVGAGLGVATTGGSLSLRDTVLAGMRVAAGARASAASLGLEGVALVGNASDGVRVDDALPAPLVGLAPLGCLVAPCP